MTDREIETVREEFELLEKELVQTKAELHQTKLLLQAEKEKNLKLDLYIVRLDEIILAHHLDTD
jgi:hypothetical protein